MILEALFICIEVAWIDSQEKKNKKQNMKEDFGQC